MYMANKRCSECDNEFGTLFRVRHLEVHYARKEWIFICKVCLPSVKENNIHYKYGGTWKG